MTAAHQSSAGAAQDKSRFLRFALVLGLLSAIGPFAIDMYLPALPAIGAALQADVNAVQLSLMSFFVAFAFSHLIYGPASDMFGRKPPMLVGIALFVIGSVGCALAPDVGWLIAFRFLQGLGGGAPSVVPRAVVRDLHTGAEAARLLSLLLLVFSVSPILAPLLGSLVIEVAGWRGIFWSVGAIGLAGLVLTAVSLPETRPAAARHGSNVRSTLRAFHRLLRDGRFMGLTAIGAFGIGSFFVYLANSSFVMINHYGLTTAQYSLAFSVNAVAFIGVSQLSGWLGARYGLARVARASALGFAVSMATLLALNLAGIDRLDVMIGLLLTGFGFLGLVLPASSVLALDDHGDIAGAASALLGALQMAMGAVVIVAMASFVDGTARPMLAGVAVAALCSLVCAHFTLRGATAATKP